MDIAEAMKMKKRTEVDILVLLKKFESATGCEVKTIKFGYDKTIAAAGRELSTISIEASLPEGV